MNLKRGFETTCFFKDCDNEVDETFFEMEDGSFACESCMDILGDQ